jgi:6,7-dimethyl-8-ribityllumazine synthase
VSEGMEETRFRFGSSEPEGDPRDEIPASAIKEEEAQDELGPWPSSDGSVAEPEASPAEPVEEEAAHEEELPVAEALPDGDGDDVPAEEDELPRIRPPDHAAGELKVPEGYGVIQGQPSGGRRSVGVVVGRFNGGLTGELLARALDELERAGVGREAVTVVPVPGAFELPLAAMALAKTRRYSCIVALGAVIRGETPHFDYVASEAASGLQLAGLETGIPVAFGVLTCDDEQQARERLDKGAEAVRTALEMADVFAQLRAAAGAAPA